MGRDQCKIVGGGVSKLSMGVHGVTNPGKVRENNEDCFLIDEEGALFAVFDGMGGHKAGDVASKMAKDVVHEYISSRRVSRGPRELLERALKRASGVIYDESRRKKERRGMGTTAVACLIENDSQAYVAHVGDSRAYLQREGRLTLLTRDHTVVSEMLAKGALSVEDAAHHPYRGVLSRNLGSKPNTEVEINVVELKPGDRLVLCSDGLTGFSSHGGMEQVLSGASSPKKAADELVELALRGGGGDNVTVLVVEAGQAPLPRTTAIVRTNGAPAWWSRRKRFLHYAKEHGVAKSPVCVNLRTNEAVEIIAGNFCEALFHDLENTTGSHIWNFVEDLSINWLAQNGSVYDVRELLGLLGKAAIAVVKELADEGEPVALPLEIAVSRGLVVADMAFIRTIAENIRTVEAGLAETELHNTAPPTLQRTLARDSATASSSLEPAVAKDLEDTKKNWKKRLSTVEVDEGVDEFLAVAQILAVDDGGESDMLNAAREVFAAKGLHRTELDELFESLYTARDVHFQSLADCGSHSLAAVKRLAVAYHGLAMAIARVAIEGCDPLGSQLKEMTKRTMELRLEVKAQEEQLVAKSTRSDRTQTIVERNMTVPIPEDEEFD